MASCSHFSFSKLPPRIYKLEADFIIKTCQGQRRVIVHSPKHLQAS